MTQMLSSVRVRRLLAGVLPGVLLAAGLVAAPLIASADETTVSYDTLRTGWDQNEPGLAPSSVSASDFGQLFSTDGRTARSTPSRSSSAAP